MSQLHWLLVLVLAGGVFPPPSQVASAKEGKPPSPKKLLIVAPNSFHGALKPFVEHKKHVLPAEVVSFESVLKNTKGADDAEKLKLYLYNRWKADQIGYVLLVGDAEVMPVRYFSLVDANEWAKASGGMTHIPSDLYYSDLAKQDGSFEDWNANKEGINARLYAQHNATPKAPERAGPVNVDQIDYLPDVAVGRWPVHTVDQVKAVVAKTIRYENHVLSDDIPAIRRCAFVNSPGLDDFRQGMDDWGKRLEAVSAWPPVRLYYKDEKRDDKTPPPNEDETVKVIESGLGMIFHIGHGNSSCWADCLDIDRVKTLKNANLTPVMFSVGCDTAAFAPIAPWNTYVDSDRKTHVGIDNKEKFTALAPPPNNYQRGKFNRTSLGVEWIRAPENGCVAYIGANVTAQSGGMSDKLMSGFINHIATHEVPRIGDAWAATVANYYHAKNLPNIKAKGAGEIHEFDEAMKFQLFGDPSMRLPRSPYPSARALVLVEGKFGNALDAKASPTWVAGDDRYRRPPITVECWAKLNNPEEYNILLSSDPKSSSRHWEIFGDRGSGAFCAYLPGYEPSEIVSAADIVDWRWHYVAMTFDGERVQLYVDGKRVADQAVRPKEGLNRDDGPLMFGQAVSPDARIGCDGLIDDVRISNAVRVIDRAPEKELPQDRQAIGLWRFDN